MSYMQLMGVGVVLTWRTTRKLKPQKFLSKGYHASEILHQQKFPAIYTVHDTHWFRFRRTTSVTIQER
jgi:hypothetical protein